MMLTKLWKSSWEHLTWTGLVLCKADIRQDVTSAHFSIQNHSGLFINRWGNPFEGVIWSNPGHLVKITFRNFTNPFPNQSVVMPV